MPGSKIDHNEIAAFMRSNFSTGPEGAESLQFRVQPVRGGLESAGVWQINAQSAGGERQPRCCIMKQLEGFGIREIRIYKEILSSAAPGLSPELLGTQKINGQWRLYLECIQPFARWPWKKTVHSAAVLRSLAYLHRSAAVDKSDPAITQWDYEAELLVRADDLLAFAESAGISSVKANLPALRRIVSVLPTLRRQLLDFSGFGPVFIHGDVHPGNVLMTNSPSGPTPVFVDWARSRIGSPLEDVSSWLQSLGYWEPEARRRHDTLLVVYLEARGHWPVISRALRDAYWLAAASNLLAGALLYHLAVATAKEGLTAPRRHAALAAVADCLRVIRRADACWTCPRQTKPRPPLLVTT